MGRPDNPGGPRRDRQARAVRGATPALAIARAAKIAIAPRADDDRATVPVSASDSAVPPAAVPHSVVSVSLAFVHVVVRNHRMSPRPRLEQRNEGFEPLLKSSHGPVPSLGVAGTGRPRLHCRLGELCVLGARPQCTYTLVRRQDPGLVHMECLGETGLIAAGPGHRGRPRAGRSVLPPCHVLSHPL